MCLSYGLVLQAKFPKSAVDIGKKTPFKDMSKRDIFFNSIAQQGMTSSQGWVD